MSLGESTSDGAKGRVSTPGAKRGRRMLQRRRRRDHDVVFYTPWVGSMLSSRCLLPPGGAETQVLVLARELARVGVRVAIIAYGDQAELPAAVDGVTIAARPSYRKPRGLLGKLAEILCIWRSLWRTPSATIVYRTANYELGILAVYARLARRRLVLACASVSDFNYHRVESRRLYRLMYRVATRLADTIVVQTEEQVLLCERTFGRKAVLIRSVVAPVPSQHELPVAFLWVGRLVWYKRPLEYVALARALPRARFWMVGVPSPTTHGDDSGLAEIVALEANDVPNLELMGPRSHSEIGDLMARAVASVNTADFEGMPNVLLEGWSRGVPALVLNHDPDGVVQKYGLGDFAEGSRAQLVACARRQWYNRADRRDISKRCRRYIETNHAPELAVKQWLQVVGASPSRTVGSSTAADETVCAA